MSFRPATAGHGNGKAIKCLDKPIILLVFRNICVSLYPSKRIHRMIMPIFCWLCCIPICNHPKGRKVTHAESNTRLTY